MLHLHPPKKPTKILKYVNPKDKPILQRQSDPVDISSSSGLEIARIIATELLKAVEEQNGAAGFSAPQLGYLKQIIAIKVFENRDTQLVLLNPKVLHRQGKSKEEEGCFSIDYEDHYYWTFKDRPFRTIIQAYDLDGNRLIIPFSVADSMIFIHEYEHLYHELIIQNLAEKIDIVRAEKGKTGIVFNNPKLSPEEQQSVIVEFSTEEEKYLWKKEHPERKREIKDTGMECSKNYIIFSDKDGTLDLDSQEGCEQLKQAILKIENEDNGLFVITTARPAGEIVAILNDKKIPVPTYIIGDNGFIFNTLENRYLTTERLPKNSIQDLVNVLIKSNYATKDTIEFSTGDVVYLQDCEYTKNAKAYEKELGTRIFSENILDCLNSSQKDLLSISFRVSSIEAVKTIKKYISENTPEVQLNYQSLDDGNYSIDLTPAGIDKAYAVLKLSQLTITGDESRNDIRGHFSVIGDGTNDISMLTMAYAFGAQAVIADINSEESQEVSQALEKTIAPYSELHTTGEIARLDSYANKSLLEIAKSLNSHTSELADSVMRRAVRESLSQNGVIPEMSDKALKTTVGVQK